MHETAKRGDPFDQKTDCTGVQEAPPTPFANVRIPCQTRDAAAQDERLCYANSEKSWSFVVHARDRNNFWV